jgi:hypothetical protein
LSEWFVSFFRLDLPELNAQELESYLSSIENDQPIYSLTGLNAQEIAEEVDLFFKNDHEVQGERMVTVYFQLLVQSYGYNTTVSRVTIQRTMRICHARVSTVCYCCRCLVIAVRLL